MSQDPKAKLASAGFDFVPTIHKDTYPFIKPEQFDLEGRAVFITGASKGVGRAVAASFAKAGASYIGLGARSGMEEVEREVQAAAKEAGRPAPHVLSLSLDVASEESVAKAAREVDRAFGRLDVLINNAGYLEDWKPIAESEPKTWWRSWEINILGVYLVSHSFVPLLLRTQHGLKSVLNMSSFGAHCLMPGASAYQTSKLALVRFSEFFNVDHGEQGLLAFSIHPGGVPTELALNMPAHMHERLQDSPALAGDAVVWLTAERRDWLAGRFVSVTWDFEELLGKREKIERGDLLKVRMDVGME